MQEPLGVGRRGETAHRTLRLAPEAAGILRRACSKSWVVSWVPQGMTSRWAPREQPRVSGTRRHGSCRCLFQRVRKYLRAARPPSRRGWTRRSLRSPSWSTAPPSYWRCPVIATQPASRHHVAPRRPCRRFTRRASSGPTFPHPCRRVSYDTKRPRSASRSSTSWKLRPYLCYTQTAWLLLSGGTRCRRSRDRRMCSPASCRAERDPDKATGILRAGAAGARGRRRWRDGSVHRAARSRFHAA